jgi:Flp pilus assembly protein TadD
MRQFHRLATLLVAAVVTLVYSAGCHQLSPSVQSQVPPGKGEMQGPLNQRQVADVQLGLGRTLEKQGELEQAEAAYREAFKQDPARGEAYLRLAIVYDRQGRFSESTELYQKALAAQPGNPEIFCDRGYSLYLQHAWSDAEMNLRQAIALQPAHVRAHTNLGLVLGRAGRVEESVDEFRKAGCTESDALVNLAFVLTLDRRWSEARKHYETALAKDSASERAQKGLEELNSLVSKAQTAAEDSGAEGTP